MNTRTLIRSSARLCCSRQQLRYYSAPGDGEIPASKIKYVSTEGTYPQGFLAGTAHVGVKASNTRFDDLAIIASETPCSAAAVFTKNRFQAAPVQLDREILQHRNGEGIRAVVINSGCANAVTGTGGRDDARRMGLETDKSLPQPDTPFPTRTISSPQDVPTSLVMSTGVIGQRLPLAKILNKIPTAVSAMGSTHDHWLRAARAICTTDTFPKLLSRQFTLPSYPRTTFSIAGMTKGAGMIHPNMATLLGVIATDAPIAASALQPLLRRAIDRSFNSISIDGDTSTNDTIALLANGAAVPKAAWHASVADADGADGQAFLAELTELARSLAQLVVRDGEGATKFVTLRVRGAPSWAVGHRLAASVARSPLVKTALYGRDANWGRILCAIGYADGVPADQEVDPTKVSVSFVPAEGTSSADVVAAGELKLLVDGEPVEGGVDEAKAARMLEEENLEILIRLGGEEKPETDVVYWTCDFSHEYVTINGDYRT